MRRVETEEKRKGGSALWIIFLILGLSLLFFIFIIKEFDIKVINRASASIEKGIPIGNESNLQEAAPTVDSRRVSVFYITRDTKLSCCFIQIINAFEKTIYYIEVPLNTKFEISSELYKELLTYAPTLPQYVKLSRAVTYFSDNYRYEACTGLLSENIGEKFAGWTVMSETDFEEFKAKTSGEKYSKEAFYLIYKNYADTCRKSISTKEAWAYYEIFDKSVCEDKGTIPGRWDKTDYYISPVQTRELIEELKY